MKQTLLLIVLLFFLSAGAEVQDHPLSVQAQQQFDEGKFEDAVSSYTQLADTFPDAKEPYYNRGLCLYELKQYNKALADFDKALAIDSSLTDAKYMRALSLEGNGNVKEAVIEYEKLSEGDTKYTLLNKRIKSYRLSVILSKNWYYMIAMMLVVILLMAVVAKSYSYRKG
ncbi:MAG TPA: tetratricopeptide repeat protein [Chitinophagales bacterium]|nr:tetratricopeptide repeat protein [Chitinophagales bacterium]